MKTVITLLERNLEISDKTTYAFIFDSTVPLLGVYPEEITLTTQKYEFTRLFTEGLFSTAKYWTQLQCPYPRECLNELWYMQTTGRMQL